MHQLVYLSRATQKFDDEQLRSLCKKSADQNKKRDVTGLLLYDGARFIQALEGPADEVREIMRRIRRDRRHGEIDLVIDKAIPARQFGDWSMDSKKAPVGCCSREFLEKVKDDVSVVDDPALRAAFIGFAVLGTNPSIPGYRCEAG